MPEHLMNKILTKISDYELNILITEEIMGWESKEFGSIEKFSWWVKDDFQKLVSHWGGCAPADYWLPTQCAEQADEVLRKTEQLIDKSLHKTVVKNLKNIPADMPPRKKCEVAIYALLVAEKEKRKRDA